MQKYVLILLQTISGLVMVYYITSIGVQQKGSEDVIIALGVTLFMGIVMVLLEINKDHSF
jgi:ABC-type Mn2+/Zn2+ transport system permease subunit